MRYHSDDILKYKNNFDKYIINESIMSWIKNVWGKIKNSIKSKVSSIIGKQMKPIDSLEDEVTITIPSSLKPTEQQETSVVEGSIESIKGYYNEALTVKYVIEKNELPIKLILTEAVKNKSEVVVVTLDNQGKKHIPEINSIVNDWDKKLRKDAGNKYDSIFGQINLASNDMSSYIINSVGKEDGNILEIYLDNLSYIKGAEFKADIGLRVKKRLGDSILKAYSLKMYSKWEVNLWNTAVFSFVRSLCSPELAEELKRELSADKKFISMLKDAKSTSKQMRTLKKTLHKSHPKVKKLRGQREKERSPINVYLAKKVNEKLQKFLNQSSTNNDLVAKRILTKMGFKDKDTNMLLAFVGKSQIQKHKSIIIDKHPELDLSNLRTVYDGGTTIKIFGSDKSKKPLILFGVKEGEKMGMFGLVSFKGLENEN